MNSRWWVGDLMLFEVLPGEAFDHLNCQHTREFDHNFSKSNFWEFAQGEGGTWVVLELTVTFQDNNLLILVAKFVQK